MTAERAALRDRLRTLEDAVRAPGRSRKAAIEEANRRRPSGAPLSTSTVSEWFTKGRPANDFADLWDVVSVLLAWNAKVPDRRPKEHILATQAVWAQVWRAAKVAALPAAAKPEFPAQIRDYLTAVCAAAARSPYQDELLAVPPVSELYVRQQVHGLSGAAEAAQATPAEVVFDADSRICVLQSGPGGGKSTLLRHHLIEAATHLLEEEVGPETVPVLVNAAALTGTAVLPQAIADAVADDLAPYALLDQPTAELFRQPPLPGGRWLVLVDGLDEVANSSARGRVLNLIATATRSATAPWSFVVATRPLPDSDVGMLGSGVPRFELQPFEAADVAAYARHCFRGTDDPERHIEAFISALWDSGLDALARTPLMAAMLCHLHQAAPDRQLPTGRSEVYRSFLELLYHQNTHKRIAHTHSEAVRNLATRYQTPRDVRAAEALAEHVRDTLPDLINELAYKRITGDPTPAIELLAAHSDLARPRSISQEHWHAFLADLLRPTGILVQQGGDFHFLHQTVLEHCAARHATRDDTARAALLVELFGNDMLPDARVAEPSYLGFLVDELLTEQDVYAEAGVQCIETAVERAIKWESLRELGYFLIEQALLRTVLPHTSTARGLAQLARSSTVDARERVRAAQALATLPGQATEACNLLLNLAQDGTLDGADRAWAAFLLTEADGYHKQGVAILGQLAVGRSPSGISSIAAFRYLRSGHCHRDTAARELHRIALDTELVAGSRTQAAESLAAMDDYRNEGAALLLRLAKDNTIRAPRQVRAAGTLSGLDGHEDEAAVLLRLFAEHPAAHGPPAVEAATFLSRLERHRDHGARLLGEFARDTSIDGFTRVQAAEALAGLDVHQTTGAELLLHFAREGFGVDVNEALNDTDDRARSASPNTHEADMQLMAVGVLTDIEEYRSKAVALLTEFARCADLTGMSAGVRVDAAEGLLTVEGHREIGLALLTELARDTALRNGLRARASKIVARHMSEPGDDVW
ncbi:NACHT domain-containing protein [Kitasatospora sp. NPDC003701]